MKISIVDNQIAIDYENGAPDLRYFVDGLGPFAPAEFHSIAAALDHVKLQEMREAQLKISERSLAIAERQAQALETIAVELSGGNCTIGEFIERIAGHIDGGDE